MRAALLTACTLCIAGVGLRFVACTENADDAARPDAGAASDRDGLPCTQASDCREGGACVHGICLGPACTCNSSNTEVLGFPTGSVTSCKGDCKPGYGCGVAGFLSSGDDLDYKGADVFRCVPFCEYEAGPVISSPGPGARDCPEGFRCTPRSTCGTAGTLAHIEVPTNPAPADTMVTLRLVIDKAYAPIHSTRWDGNANGVADGNEYRFTPQSGTAKYQILVSILDEQGGQASIEQFVNVCRGENQNCQPGDADPCCPGLRCVDSGDAGGFLTCIP